MAAGARGFASSNAPRLVGHTTGSPEYALCPPAAGPYVRSYDSSLRAENELAAPLNENFPYQCGSSSCQGWDQLSMW